MTAALAFLIDHYVSVELAWLTVVIGGLVLLWLHELHKPIGMWFLLFWVNHKPLSILTCVVVVAALFAAGMAISRFRLPPHPKQLVVHPPKIDFPSTVIPVQPEPTRKARSLPPPVSPLSTPTINIIVPSCAEDESHPYKCKSNAELGQWMIDESSKTSEMANKTVDKIKALRTHSTDETDDIRQIKDTQIRGEQAFFNMDMNRCLCLEKIKNMRKEALERLGPVGESAEEEREWLILTTWKTTQGISPWQVHAYAPYLSNMGSQLQGLVTK